MKTLTNTKKSNFSISCFLACGMFLFFAVSCGGDDDEDTVMPGAATISLSDLKRGEGSVNVTGDEQFTLSPDATLVYSGLSATINGKDYEVFRVTLSEQGPTKVLSVSLNFYIPASLNQINPPAGTFIPTTEGAALDETYVEIFVVGENEAYNTFTSSTGAVTVSNITNDSFPFVFDIEFNANNLTSFDDLTIDVQGAIKWGL